MFAGVNVGRSVLIGPSGSSSCESGDNNRSMSFDENVSGAFAPSGGEANAVLESGSVDWISSLPAVASAARIGALGASRNAQPHDDHQGDLTHRPGHQLGVSLLATLFIRQNQPHNRNKPSRLLRSAVSRSNLRKSGTFTRRSHRPRRGVLIRTRSVSAAASACAGRCREVQHACGVIRRSTDHRLDDRDDAPYVARFGSRGTIRLATCSITTSPF